MNEHSCTNDSFKRYGKLLYWSYDTERVSSFSSMAFLEIFNESKSGCKFARQHWIHRWTTDLFSTKKSKLKLAIVACQHANTLQNRKLKIWRNSKTINKARKDKIAKKSYIPFKIDCDDAQTHWTLESNVEIRGWMYTKLGGENWTKFKTVRKKFADR